MCPSDIPLAHFVGNNEADLESFGNAFAFDAFRMAVVHMLEGTVVRIKHYLVASGYEQAVVRPTWKTT